MKKGKTIAITAIVATLVTLLLVMISTCPDKDAHIDALDDVFTQVVNESIDEQGNSVWFFGKLLSKKVVTVMLRHRLEIKPCIFFNAGLLDDGKEKQLVSIGVLGKVHTIPVSILKKNFDIENYM